MQVQSMAATAPFAPVSAPVDAPCDARGAEACMASDELVTGSGVPAEATAEAKAAEANWWIDWFTDSWFYRSFTSFWTTADPSEDDKQASLRRSQVQQRNAMERVQGDRLNAAAQQSEGLSAKQCLEACKDLKDAARFQFKMAEMTRAPRPAAAQ